MPAQVRPTASEAALKAAAAARAAVATAKAAQDNAMAAAAAVADAALEHRQTDAAEAAALREGRELARRQAVADWCGAIVLDCRRASPQEP